MTMIKIRTTAFVLSMFRPGGRGFVAKFSTDDFIRGVRIKPCGTEEVVDMISEAFRGLTVYKKRSILQINWFFGIEFRPDWQIKIEIGNAMREFLLGTEKSLPTIDFVNMLKFDSPNSAKLYAVARKFERIGEFIFTVDWIRKLSWAEVSQYTTYELLKSGVIDPSVAEIAEHTGLSLSYEEVVDSSGAVTELCFSLSRNAGSSVAAG